MKRISTSTKVTDKFGAGKHGFTDGNVGVGTPPTDLEADLFDHLQEEICNPIEAVGLAPDGGSREQLLAAIRILIRRGTFSVAAGTADAMTVVLTPAATALTDGMEVRVRCLGPNTSTGPTLKLDALAAKTIVGPDGGALILGAYVNNWPAIFRYRLATDKFELLNPARQAWRQFFVNSGTFTVPLGVTRVYVSICGGGGGGGSGSASAAGGGGGGAAAIVKHLITVTPGEAIVVTVGSGGAGGPLGSSGAAGQTSSFGSYVTTAAGSGGAHGTSGSGGVPGTAPAGIPSASAGGYGEYGPSGGSGGGSAFGQGGNNHAGGVGTQGVGFGSGGGGGGLSASGGNGAAGFCLVEW